MAYHKVLNIVPWAVHKALVYPSCVLKPVSASPSLPLHLSLTPLPLGNHRSILGVCDSASVSESESFSVVSDSLRPHGLWPMRFPHPWSFPGKNTGVGCHFLLQGIFPIQGSNPGLLPPRQMFCCLSHQEAVFHRSVRWSRILDSTCEWCPVAFVSLFPIYFASGDRL